MIEIWSAKIVTYWIYISSVFVRRVNYSWNNGLWIQIKEKILEFLCLFLNTLGLPCPVGMVQSQRGTDCPNTCGNPTAEETCKGTTGPMCVCAEGLLLEDGDRCVHPSQCGCTYEGKYYKVNFCYGSLSPFLSSRSHEGPTTENLTRDHKNAQFVEVSVTSQWRSWWSSAFDDYHRATNYKSAVTRTFYKFQTHVCDDWTQQY